MIFNRKHFPILVILLIILTSCNWRDEVANGMDYDALQKKADFYFNEEQLDSAFFYTNKSLVVANKNDEKTYALLQMANIQQKIYDFSGSELTATEAYKENTNKAYLPYIYNTLGIAYEEQNIFDEALKYYNKCYHDTLKEVEKCVVKNNIGVVYLSMHKFHKAKTILEPLINNDSLQHDSPKFAKVLDNLGYAYLKTNSANSFNLLNKSFKIRDSIANESELISSHMHLAEYYIDKDLNLANEHAKKAYQCATNSKSPYDRLEALQFLIKCSNPQEAKKIAIDQIELSDSINKGQAKVNTQFAMMKLDSSEAIKKYEAQKRQKYLYIVMLVLFSIVAAYIFATIRKKNYQKLKTVSYETETRISKRIHDELANDVFNALTFAETQNLQDPNNKEILLENLDTIYARTRNISKENSEIDTGKDFAKHLIQLLAQYESNSVNVIIHKITSIEWEMVKKEVKIALYRVLQELMVNMKKHSNCSVVIVRFENKKSQIEVYYSDNGKGVKMLKSKKGLQNAENRILAIKGTITFDFETATGFKVKIGIPK